MSLNTEVITLVNFLVVRTSRDKCHVKQHDLEQGRSIHRNLVHTSQELHITVNKIDQQKMFKSKTAGKVQMLVK